MNLERNAKKKARQVVYVLPAGWQFPAYLHVCNMITTLIDDQVTRHVIKSSSPRLLAAACDTARRTNRRGESTAASVTRHTARCVQ